MRTNNKTNDIINYIIQNPSMKQIEIAKTFGITRQRVEQIFKHHLTDEQKTSREESIKNEYIENVFPLIKEGTSRNIISALTGYSLKKIEDICKLSPISEYIAEKEKNQAEYIDAVSADWMSGMPIAEIMVKHSWGGTVQKAATHISRLRSKYPDKFPIRLNNQTSLTAQHDSYVKLKSEGMDAKEIATILGYKNVVSMRAAFYSLNNKHANNKD